MSAAHDEHPWRDFVRVMADAVRPAVEFVAALINAFLLRPQILGDTRDGWPRRFRLWGRR